ncbi:MAG: glycosyltransferase family 2 protein [Anaerolineales bacterium]
MPLSLSVIIPTYNRRASVERLLRSLDAQTLPPDQFEVIIVIDGSEDGTRELVAGWKAAYRLRGIWQTNQKQAAARNNGVRASSGDLIVFLDDDMEAVPGLLAAHQAAHAGGELLGVVGAVHMRLPPNAPPVADYWSRRFERLAPILGQPGYCIPPGEFYVGNFSIGRQPLLAAGVFDAGTFGEYGAEDVELAYRLERQGVRIVYSLKAISYQHHTKDMAELLRDRLAEGRTEVAMVSKHPELWPATQLSEYTHASPGLRAARSFLLTTGRLVPGFSAALAHGLAWLDGRGLAWPDRWYVLAMGYYYWLGADQAVRANRRTGQGLTQLRSVPPAGKAGPH